MSGRQERAQFCVFNVCHRIGSSGSTGILDQDIFFVYMSIIYIRESRICYLCGQYETNLGMKEYTCNPMIARVYPTL